MCVKKLKISCSSNHTILSKFHQRGVALVTVTRKSFKGKLLQKLFSDRIFHVIIADTDIGSLKSLYRPTLFDK